MSLSRVTETVKRRGKVEQFANVPVELYPIALVAVGLRLFRLRAESYWVDEAISVNLVESKTVVELLFRFRPNDPHPPLYYVLLDGWTTVFGTSEFATRLLSALLGVAAVIVLYRVGWLLFDRRIGAVSALLAAVSPFQIWFSQETRMYSLLVLLTVVSFYWFLRIHADGSAERSITRSDVGYVLSTVLLGYAHFFALFAILAQNLYVLSRPFVRAVPRSRLTIRRWLALQGGTAVLLGPWLFELLQRAVAASGGGGGVSWIPMPTAETVRQTFVAYLGSLLFQQSFPVLVTLLVSTCIILALSVRDTEAAETVRRGAPVNSTYLVVLWLVTPILVPVLLSYVLSPIYRPHYSIGASLAFFLLVAKGVRAFSRPSLQYVVLGLLLVGLALPLSTYYENDQKQQWREAATQVEGTVAGDDVVLIKPHWTKAAFEYYFDRRDVSIVSLPPDPSVDDVRQSIDGYDDVWVVLSYAGGSSEPRVLQLVNNQSGYRGPVEEGRYIGVSVYRFNNTSSPSSTG